MKDITLTPTEQDTAYTIRWQKRLIKTLEAQVLALTVALTITFTALLLAMYKLFLGGVA